MAAIATPLFAAGVILAYTVLPYGLQVLFGFTPEGVENIVSVDKYLSFFIRTILIFGVGFLVPLLLVLLNFAGVVTGRRLINWWRWIIISILLFAAVATPTGDPINLLLLAVPILILVMLAVACACSMTAAGPGVARESTSTTTPSTTTRPRDSTSGLHH